MLLPLKLVNISYTEAFQIKCLCICIYTFSKFPESRHSSELEEKCTCLLFSAHNWINTCADTMNLILTKSVSHAYCGQTSNKPDKTTDTLVKGGFTITGTWF